MNPAKSHKALKVTLLLLLGIVLVGSFATFAILFCSYERGDDSLNEDTLYAQAKDALATGNSPVAAEIFHRLVALNPFEKRYEDAYLHALVAIRDFETLATATNKPSLAFTMTEEEQAVEASINRGVNLLKCHSNELAVATFAATTNLNYFCMTPFLVQALASDGRISLALSTALAYTEKFPHPGVLQQATEWSALSRRRDLLCTCRARALTVRGRVGITLAHYCDALIAWLDGSVEGLVKALDDLNGEVKTPLTHLMKLQCAAMIGTAEAVEQAYDETVQGSDEGSQLVSLARAAVKGFLSSHFPSKVTIDEIQRLTTLILDPKNPDVDILRLSILVKSVRGTLLPQELDDALRRFPNDRGLLKIKNREARQ